MEQSSENQKIIEKQKQAHSQVCQMPVVSINITPKAILLIITQMQLAAVIYCEDVLSVKRISETGKQLQFYVKWPEPIELILNEGWEKIIQKVSKQPINVSNADCIFNDLVKSDDDQHTQSADDVNADIPVIADMEREYGSNFERMSQMEKIYLISVISKELYRSKVWSKSPDKMWQLAKRITNAISEWNDGIALIQKLINSL